MKKVRELRQKRLAWAGLIALLVLAFLFLGAAVAGAEETTEVSHEWKLDTSVSSRSNFKFFGSTASQDAISQVNLKVDFGEWDVTVIGVEGIGRHEPDVGATADYYTVIPRRAWEDLGENDQWSVSAGSEFFFSPAQLGGDHLIFVAPFLTATFDQNEAASWTFGLQSPQPIDTEYGGDTVFVWVESSLEKSWGSFTASVTPGVVLGESGRYTFYLGPKVEWEVQEGLSVYVAGLTARNVERDGTSSWIDPTPTVGFALDF